MLKVALNAIKQTKPNKQTE